MKGRTFWFTCVLVMLVLGACSKDDITSPESVDSGVPMPSTSALQLSQQETPDPKARRPQLLLKPGQLARRARVTVQGQPVRLAA